MKQYVMALDQGTTSSRCILFDRRGQAKSVAQQEFRQIYPKPGWVEHDPTEIWQTQLRVAKQALNEGGVTASDIAAIGITNQRETTILWDRHTGEPVYNAIVWQCRRTAERIDGMVADGLSDYVHETTGLVPDAYYSASKIAWILDNVEGVRQRAEAGEILFGTVDTWLIWNLTGGKVHVTDYTNASRTMLYDIQKLCWDEKILSYFRIPESMLPEVRPSSCVYGYTDRDVLGDEIPIAGAAGDQQAALFGQCCFEDGEAKNTYGTGCFLLMNIGKKRILSQKGLLTTLAAGVNEKPAYALEGSIFVAGAAVQWLRDELHMIDTAAETEEIALSVEDTNGMYVVPAFTGMGAPYWDQYARGTIVGITRGCNRAHMVRATLESIAYQTEEILQIMEEESGVRLKELKVDGGASRNNFLMQFQSNILNVPVLRPDCVETTALGAAYLAGIAVGYWENEEDICANWTVERTFAPDMSEEARSDLIKNWKRAVSRSFEWEVRSN